MFEPRNVTTVFDLLYKVENASVLRGDRPSGSRERYTDAPPEVPSVEPDVVPAFPSRNPTSAERKAIHAEALRAIESRTLRSSHPATLHRRKSDYEGPRRRATDDPAEPPVFKGPYRRATDHLSSYTLSAERKSEAKSDDVVRTNPLLVPPTV